MLTASLLAEDIAHPRIHAALEALLDAMMLGASRQRWLGDIARYELLLLGELGFGLDLGSCAATGTTQDLAYVSPKSSQAVSRAAGLPYAAKLLPLPALLRDLPIAEPDWDDVAGALRTTGYFLERDLLTGRLAGLLDARGRLAALATSRPALAKAG